MKTSKKIGDKKNMGGVYNAAHAKSAVLIFIMLFSTLIFPWGISAQTDNIKFEQISIEQGLSQSTAFCILQDKMGFLWVGTQHGLNRYDGHSFKLYDHNPKDPDSLSHNLVISIFEDASGILWVGTWGGGLNKFDPKTGTFKNHINEPDKFGNIKYENVWSICEDNDGTLWFGTNKGLYRNNNERNLFELFLSNSGKSFQNKVRAVYKDGKGIIWAGTGDGLYKHNKDTDGFIHYPNKQGNSDQNKVRAIYEDSDKTLWIGTENGLYGFDREKGKFNPYADITDDSYGLNFLYISSICQDRSGKLWIGTRNSGVFIVDLSGENCIIHKVFSKEPGNLSDNDVQAIIEDNDGLIWIGTFKGGLKKFDPNWKKFTLYRNIPRDKNSLSNNDVQVIRKGSSGNIWIGTRGGINKFEPGSETFTTFKIGPDVSSHQNRNKIRALLEDHSGTLWAGSEGAGLYRLQPGKTKFEQYIISSPKVDGYFIGSDEHILIIYEDNDHELWIGTKNNGLIRIGKDREKDKWHYKNTPNNPESLSNNDVFSIYADRSGIIWIGTGPGGLNKFDKKQERFIRYKPSRENPYSLSNKFILAILEDKSGTLWLGTNGGGLNKFDREKETFSAYTKKQHGLPNDVIYDILEDDGGNLWLSTNRGLSRFDRETGRFRNHSVREGLQDYEFNRGAACKIENDNGCILYFGGLNGMNRFDPKEIIAKERKSPPPIVITSFKMRGLESKLNYSYAKPDPLELSYKDDFISFEFVALSFSEPEKNQYAYKLEPVHKEWIQLGNKHDVDLINLEPGNYTLKVKGSNNDGFWNQEGTKIKIIVTPPFTQTLWFYICLVLFVGGSIFGFVRWRINIIIKSNIRLQKEIDERQRAEEKLRESEKLYRTLIETSPDAIALYDSDMKNGTIVMANQQAAALLGYTDVAEMQADVKNFFDLVDESDFEKASKSVEEIIKGTGINKNTEYTMRTKDGKPISVEINTSLIKDNDGHPRYLLSIARDISKRKEAEKKEKLHREKLIQVDRMVSLGRLVSGVAHELNNPVASIKMNSEIFDRVWKDIVPVLDKYYKDKKDFSLSGIPYLDAKKRLEELIIGFMEGSQRIEKIINDLRDFSRPGDPLIREHININKAIQSSVNLTNNLLKKNTKRFSLRLAKNLPLIQGNFQKLEQVFINLIQNACQALPDNNKKILIKSHYNKENKHIVTRVKDEGVGIDDKYLRFITDPFFTTRRGQGGIGLGLSISMQIIQEHNGNMKFQSEKGKGTTVTVSLPVNEK